MHNPDEIVLNQLTKQFEYEAISRKIDGCNDLKDIKMLAKCYIKLYLSTIETISNLDLNIKI